MKRSVVVVLLTLLLNVSSLPAAEHPLEAIPDSAAVVVRIASPDSSLQTVAEFVGKIDPQLRQMVMFGSSGMGAVIRNPTRAGVDSERDWWLVMFIENGRFEPLVAVAPSDAEKARESVLGQAIFTTHDDWLLYARSQSVIDAVNARISGTGNSIMAIATPDSHKLFNEAHAAAFVNMSVVTDKFAQQMERAHDEASATLRQMAEFAPEVQGFNIAPVFEMYASMLDGIFQAVEDMESITVTVRFGDDALYFTDLVQFESGTQSASAVARHQPQDLGVLDRLPAGQLAYIGVRVDFSSMMEWGTRFWKEMITDEAAAEQIEKGLDALKDIQFKGYYGSFGLKSIEGGALTATVLAEASPIAKLKAASIEMGQIGGLKMQGIDQEFEFKPAAEKAAGYDVDLVRVKQTFSPEIDPLQIQNEIVRVLYGDNGLVTRQAYPGDFQLQSIGGGLPAMEAAIKRLESDTTNPDLDALREYGKSANMMFLLDLPRLATAAMSLAVEHGQLPIPFSKESLAELKMDPSYFAVGLKMGERSVRVDTRVPIEQFQGIARLVKFVQDSMQARPEF